MIQVGEIKYPWHDAPSQWWPKGYRHSFITIWHVDPESDGSDDSCGWHSPKLTKDQREAMHNIADQEAREPYYLAFKGKKIENPTEAETLLRQAFFLVGMVLNRRFHMKKVTLTEASEWACEMMANPTDNFRSSLAFLAGYHSNFVTDNVSDREICASELFCSLARFILRERRPWYRHPRYHFWHYSLQIHPLQHFKRWAFSRCEKCGKGFAWGYAPISGSWNGTGPLWFRSEKYVQHGDCQNPTSDCLASAK